MKKAFITGINGQDGSYLAELLIEKGYTVIGLIRRLSVAESKTARLEKAKIYPHPQITLEYGDMCDQPSLLNILRKHEPDEIYNLAAQSHVRVSFDAPHATTDVVALGTLNLLESVRAVCPKAKIYQAGSSEMFGNCVDSDGFQRETTPMHPVSPYGCAKLYAYNLCSVYRDAYDMFICNGVLFNHESPRRGRDFVTNKVVLGAYDIFCNKLKILRLGNLKATRDWGHAKDYVRAMWMMLQEDKPDDYVVATGVSTSVEYLCNYIFGKMGLVPELFIEIDPAYYRPKELHELRGDSSKIREALGWTPEYSFEGLIDDMLEAVAGPLVNPRKFLDYEVSPPELKKEYKK